MILDATRGSVARFVNRKSLLTLLHRKFDYVLMLHFFPIQDSCDPNCRMEKWLVDGKPRMALFAGDEGIEAGDELTYDYNFK